MRKFFLLVFLVALTQLALGCSIYTRYGVNFFNKKIYDICVHGATKGRVKNSIGAKTKHTPVLIGDYIPASELSTEEAKITRDCYLKTLSAYYGDSPELQKYISPQSTSSSSAM